MQAPSALASSATCLTLDPLLYYARSEQLFVSEPACSRALLETHIARSLLSNAIPPLRLRMLLFMLSDRSVRCMHIARETGFLIWMIAPLG